MKVPFLLLDLWCGDLEHSRFGLLCFSSVYHSLQIFHRPTLCLGWKWIYQNNVCLILNFSFTFALFLSKSFLVYSYFSSISLSSMPVFPCIFEPLGHIYSSWFRSFRISSSLSLLSIFLFMDSPLGYELYFLYASSFVWISGHWIFILLGARYCCIPSKILTFDLTHS